MAGLLPRWADTAFRVVLIGIALAVPGVFVLPIVYARTPYNLDRGFPVDQPVQFDHRHHVQDDGIECLYCHSTADRSPSAGVPATEVCMGCHAQVWSQSPMLEPVRRSWFSGLPIPWNRVHAVPDFVFFNHAVHVRGGIDCAACHGDLSRMALAYQVAPLTMGWCLDCHRQRIPAATHELPVLERPHLLPPDTTAPRTLEGVSLLTTCTACHR